MSDDEQLRAEGAEEAAPRVASPTPAPQEMLLFDDVVHELLAPLDDISSTTTNRIYRDDSGSDEDPRGARKPRKLESADVQEPSAEPLVSRKADPLPTAEQVFRRPGAVLRTPDAAIPRFSPHPRDVRQSRTGDAESAADAVIHAMRIISVGEPAQAPPDSEPDVEIEPEDDAAALDAADVESTWTPPSADVGPHRSSAESGWLSLPTGEGGQVAWDDTARIAAELDDVEIEPDLDVPDAPLATPMHTERRLSAGNALPTPSPPLAAHVLSPSASAPPPPAKAGATAARHVPPPQPVQHVQPFADEAWAEEDTEELTDDELALDSADRRDTDPTGAAWDSPPVSVPVVAIRGASAEARVVSVVEPGPAQPHAYGRAGQPHGGLVDAAARQAMGMDLSTTETPLPTPRPGVATSPTRDSSPPTLPAEGRAEDRTLRRGRRARPGWEEVFSDDFVRSFRRLMAEQVAAEVNFIEESLGVQRGGVVLDLGCGMGQHAVEFAARGYRVVGYDLSLTMLALAADEAQERAQKINFLQGDMREMAFEEMFDGVYSWATSFGFFDEEKNASVVRRVHRSLRKGGLFLLDLVNRDYIVSRLPALAWFEGDGCVCIDDARFDSITSRLRVKRTIMLEDGTSREVEYSVRLYSLHEIGRVLHEAGFRVVEVSGHPATPGAFFDADSPRVITVAERK